ncbi:MAG: hypothetical protein HY577_01545 [Candidatus Nealsonbacteria bacterium]|nr:hypothetical protein [Candidatus Nealsonbacteria bacterium]
MKKILFVLLFASLVVPMLALAQTGPEDCCKIRRNITVDGTPCASGTVVGPTGGTCSLGITCTTEKWGLFCAMNTLYAITDWIFLFLILIVILLVIFGAFKIMMSAGDAAKVKEGRDMIMYAAIGLLVALVSRAVPSIVKAILGYT